MVGSGFLRDLVSLKNRLPTDMIVWFWEHVAFEKSEMLAHAYLEVVISSLVYSSE